MPAGDAGRRAKEIDQSAGRLACAIIGFMITQIISSEVLEQFCRRWAISELALFGSIMREDFSPESDIDVLVTFEPEAEWGLLDHIQMELELSELLGREVDLLTRQAVERSQNPLRRREILDTAQTIYAA